MEKAYLRVIDTGYNDGFMNMAIDEAISIALSENRVPITLRFYRWNPPTLSIGYFQKAEKEVDFDDLKKHNIGFVRRPTGGRAVLHDKEITYSIILKEDYKNMPDSVTESYRILSMPLLNGLIKMGLSAQMTKPLTKKLEHTTSACFDAPSSYEIIVNNKKIIGSAQKRFYGIILQHGSIPYELDIDLLFDCLKFENEKKREILKKYFEYKATSIFQELGKTLEWDYMVNIFKQEYSKWFELEIKDENLTAYEIDLANKLYKEKYSTDKWNFKY